MHTLEIRITSQHSTGPAARREVFEQAFKGSYNFYRNERNKYAEPATRQAWVIWQRAIIEAETKS